MRQETMPLLIQEWGRGRGTERVVYAESERGWNRVPLPSLPVISHNDDGFDWVEGELGQLCLVDQLQDVDKVVECGEGD